ncbi:hypothetical protein [Alloacidobacterium sp.]|uniref:bestrophin-like domain n=1 Tax=Alloacidobacterium sp. TaxID=2951999 RepID=UPI002D335663|nr:hypothetical protein [Alloacidobacterium sp.]HYK36583.1 hypothetical protein [Alloacidobacterium sp.]
MTRIFTHPFVLFAFSLAALLLSVQVGSFLASRLQPVKEEERQDLDLVVSASLTLLALIIGFSFSLAVSRYDQRKNYEEEEANAIGTEYIRADLLPAAEAARLRQLLPQYLDRRLLFYTSRDPRQLEIVDKETAQLQAELWSTVQSVAAAAPNPVVALVVSGMNDVLNWQGYTQAAWWNRIPAGAWSLMAALAGCCCILIGYSAHQRGAVLFTVVPVLVSIAFFLIADIDSPRRGIIRVAPQNLMSLSQSLHAQ